MPGRSMNVIDFAVLAEIAEIAARLKDDKAIRGAVLASGKASFCAGADLIWLQSFAGHFAEAAARRTSTRRASAL